MQAMMTKTIKKVVLKHVVCDARIPSVSPAVSRDRHYKYGGLIVCARIIYMLLYSLRYD